MRICVSLIFITALKIYIKMNDGILRETYIKNSESVIYRSARRLFGHRWGYEKSRCNVHLHSVYSFLYSRNHSYI